MTYYYDHANRLVLLVLMPLLLLNALIWRYYTGSTVMAIIWFVAFIVSASLYRRNYD